MFEKLWNAQPTAARRRIHFTFRDATTGNNATPASVTGKKAVIRVDGTGTLLTTTNDVVITDSTNMVGAGYIELTAGELTALGTGELVGQVNGITGIKVEDFQATLYPFDPNDPGATAASVATASAAAILATPANKLVTAADGSVLLSVTDEGNIASIASKVDATVSSRASQASLNSGVTLTAGERNTTIAQLLAAVIETNGGVTLSVKQALQLAAAWVVGKVSGITAGTGSQTTVLRSATDLQTIATYTDDENGNRSNVVQTIP